ncbi:MAG TPA: hypothetical protein VHB02_05985 [Acidimicrobiales bacterium]|nr:hypothetical protein [Acidimicrobiales bacterium]
MVLHTEVGWEHTVEHEFTDPSYQASAFCSISGGLNAQSPPDGHLHQYGPIGHGWMAWAQKAGNPRFRSVEFEDGGRPTRPLTALQIATGGAVLAAVAEFDGFPIQSTDDPDHGRGLILHVDGGAAWGGHDCPGAVRAAQRPALIAAAFASITPAPPAPSPTQEVTMYCTDPETGKVIATDADGNVYAEPGIPDIQISTLGQHPAWHAGSAESGGTNPCIGITPWRDPQGRWGLAFLTEPVGGKGGFGPYDLYHLGRDGTPH